MFYNLLVDPSDTLYALWIDNSQRVYFANKTFGNSWSAYANIFNGTVCTQYCFNKISAVIDSNNVIHTCIVTGGWNASASNDWLIYTNWTQAQGWWGDGSVFNG